MGGAHHDIVASSMAPLPLMSVSFDYHTGVLPSYILTNFIINTLLATANWVKKAKKVYYN